MFTKIAALVLVIIVGVYHMSMGTYGCFLIRSPNFQLWTLIEMFKYAQVTWRTLKNRSKIRKHIWESCRLHSIRVYSLMLDGMYHQMWLRISTNRFQIYFLQIGIYFSAGTTWILWQKSCVTRTKICHVPFIFRCHWWRVSMCWRTWLIWRSYPKPKCFHRMQSQWYEHVTNHYWRFLFNALILCVISSIADIRKQSAAGFWCVDHPIHGCNISVWWLMRSYHGVVAHVLCWRTKWPYAIHVGSHKHQYVHTDTIFGFSGMDANYFIQFLVLDNKL